MRQFDGARNYYSLTFCCDGKRPRFETEIIPPHKQWQGIKL